MLLYPVAHYTMNEYVFNQLITRRSRQSGYFEITTAGWLAVDNVIPLFYEILYAHLYAAGIYLGSFGKICEYCPLPCALDLLLVFGVYSGGRGSSGNPSRLVEPGRDSGSNGSGENPPGLIVPGRNSGSNRSGGNPFVLVGPSRNRLGSGGFAGKAMMLKKDTPPEVNDDSESISSLADH